MKIIILLGSEPIKHVCCEDLNEAMVNCCRALEGKRVSIVIILLHRLITLLVPCLHVGMLTAPVITLAQCSSMSPSLNVFGLNVPQLPLNVALSMSLNVYCCLIISFLQENKHSSLAQVLTLP